MAKRIVRTLTTLETGYLSVPEFAAHLSVGRKQVMKWILAGTLPAVKIDRTWRIGVNEADAFLQRNRFQVTA